MIENFLSNSGYATWSQTIIVILSVLLAYITLVSNDRNINVANALSFVQKYYLESNSLALKSLSLRVNQFDRVQEAKTLIVGYDPNSDASFNILFEKARPLVRSSFGKQLTIEEQLC